MMGGRDCKGGNGWKKWLRQLILALILVSFANQFALLFTLTEEGMGIQFAARTMPLGYGVRGKYIAICDMLIAALFTIWLIRAALYGQLKQLKWRNYPLCLLALLAVAVLSTLNSHSVWGELFDKLTQYGLSAKGLIKAMLFAEPFREAATELIQWTLYLAAFPLLAVALIQHADDDEKAFLLDVVLLLTLINEAVAVYDYIVRSDPTQVAGLFGSRNIYSGYLALTLPLLLSHSLHSRSNLRMALCAIAVLLGMFTSLSGWCWLGLTLGLGMVAWLHSRRAAWVWAIGVTAFLCVTFAFQMRFYKEALPHVFDPYDDELDVRKEYIEWQAALNGMSQDAPPPRSNFPLGFGAGGYQININAYYGSLPNKEKMPFDSNSLYLVVGMTLGFIGMATLLFMLIHNGALAIELHRRSGSAFGKTLGAGMVGTVVAFAISSIFTNLLVRGTGPLIIFFITLLHASRNHIRTQ